jgi:uncharacterized phage infection (PIP) family protein YhgE
VSSITQTKAEVQKLIKLYNKLQAEAKKTDTEDAAHKVAQAKKLVSQINTLQHAISKTKNKNSVEQAKKITTSSPKLTEDKNTLEERINHIENAQKTNRAKIEQLNLAKADLSRLQIEAEKNLVRQQNRFKEDRKIQAQEFAKITEQIKTKEAQYQSIKKELDAVRSQAEKEMESLKRECDAAVEKQKNLEKDKISLLRYGSDSGSLKGLLMGLGLGIFCIVVFMLVFFKTTLLDEVVCQKIKGEPTTAASQGEPIGGGE